MSESRTVTFRLPAAVIKIAEQRVQIAGEKSIGLMCKNIVLNELQSKEKMTGALPAKINDIDMLFLLRAIGNSRELILRSFQMMFELTESGNEYDFRTSNLEVLWKEMQDEYDRSSDEQYEEFNALTDELNMVENLIA